jgi:hypothetical protein
MKKQILYLVLGLLIMSTAYVVADGNLPVVGNLLLNPTGDVQVDATLDMLDNDIENVDSLAVTTISGDDDGVINLVTSGDADDYLRFETVDDTPRIHTVGAEELEFYGDGAARFKIYDDDSNGSGDEMISAIYGGGIEGTYGYSWLIGDFKDDDDYLTIRNLNDAVNIQPHGDLNHYLRFRTTAHIPRIKVIGGGDVYFTSDDGNGWADIHGDRFIEYTAKYEGTISMAKQDLEEWIDAEHPDRLAPPTDDSIKKGTDLGMAGKATAKVVLDLDERVKLLEAELCKKDASYEFC